MATAVIGAGGPTGRECVKRLQQLRLPVRAVVRDPTKHSAALEGEGVEVVRGDVSDVASLREALGGVKGIIFAASAQTYWAADSVDHQGVANTVAAAPPDAHVVLVSSMLVHPANRWHLLRVVLNNVRYGLMDAKYKGEEALHAHHSFTIIRPGGLSNGQACKTEILSALDTTTERGGGSIHRSDVAALSVDALSNPAARNKVVSVWTKKQPLAAGEAWEALVARVWAGNTGAVADAAPTPAK